MHEATNIWENNVNKLHSKVKELNVETTNKYVVLGEKNKKGGTLPPI